MPKLFRLGHDLRQRGCSFPQLWLLGLIALPPQAGAAAGAIDRPSECGDASQARRLGGVSLWFCDQWEYDYLEAFMFVALVMLALAFDRWFEWIEHKAENGYAYGQALVLKEDWNVQKRAQIVGSPLTLNMVHRMGREFMVLGFLAFAVWSFNQAGGFDAISGINHNTDDIRFPPTGVEYLHMMESVHMHLFLGMASYFLVVCMVVIGAARRNKAWEDMHIERISFKRNTGASPVGLHGAFGLRCQTQNTTALAPTMSRNLHDYIHWRAHFLDAIVPVLMRFFEEEPGIFEDFLAFMGITPHDSLDKDFLGRLVDQSNFSAYLAHSVRHCVMDMIEVHPITWMAVLVLFLLKVPMHRFLHVSHLDLNLFIFGVSLVVALTVLYWVHQINKRSIASGRAVQCEGMMDGTSTSQSTATHGSQHRHTIHNRKNTETVILRMLQVVLFLLSYTLARELASAHTWQQNPSKTLVIVLSHVALLVLLALVLPRQIPWFAALMALPPYVDRENVRTMLFVMEASLQHLGGYSETSETAVAFRRAKTANFMSGGKLESGPPVPDGAPGSLGLGEMTCRSRSR